MAYTFRGVFIERPAQSAAELEELFGGYARAIETPFEGVVLSFRNDLEVADNKNSILEKSRKIPDSRVAFIYYGTFGGMLDHVEGFACQNGALVEGSERDTNDASDQSELESTGNDILNSLLESVGARRPSSNFEPFERGFFPNT